MNTTVETPASVEAAPEGSFGTKPSTAQVDTLTSVMAALQQSGKVSQPLESDTPVNPPEAAPETEATSAEPENEAPAVDAEKPESTAEKKDKPKKGSLEHRINELTYQKKQAEETYAKEKADLEARISELEVSEPTEPEAAEPPAPEGLLALDSQTAVDAHRAHLEALKDMLDDHKTTGWEGSDAQGAPLEYTPELIRSKLASVRAELRQLPQVEKALRARDEKFRPVLTERYEWWSDKSDARHTEAQALLRQFPELRRAPNHELIIANHIAMERQLAEAAAKPKETPKAAKPVPSQDDPPPVPSTPAVAPTTHRTTPQAKLSGEALSRVQGGDRNALASFVKGFMQSGR